MPVNITEDFVRHLMEQNISLTKQVDELNATVREFNQTIRELKKQLGKNSNNSFKLPSSDGLKKPPVSKNRSLRQKSGKKQGAQDGHDGVNLFVIAEPDHVEHHMHSDCNSCPYHDRCLEKSVNITAHELVVVSSCPLHAVCCAHLLRELNGVEENHPEQKWATQFKELLITMKKVKDKALAAGEDEVSYYHLHKFDKQYDEILKTVYEENPLLEPTVKKWGR